MLATAAVEESRTNPLHDIPAIREPVFRIVEVAMNGLRSKGFDRA